MPGVSHKKQPVISARRITGKSLLVGKHLRERYDADAAVIGTLDQAYQARIEEAVDRHADRTGRKVHFVTAMRPVSLEAEEILRKRVLAL
jgi:hypothetical protein